MKDEPLVQLLEKFWKVLLIRFDQQAQENEAVQSEVSRSLEQ